MPDQAFDFSEHRRRATSPPGGEEPGPRDLGHGGTGAAWSVGGAGPPGPPGRRDAADPADLHISRPPVLVLAVAGSLGAVGLLLAALAGRTPALAFVGWGLAGPVGFMVLAYFTHQDTRRRAVGLYVAPSWTAAAYWSAVLLTVLGLVVGSLQIAQWAARQ